jgi:hypothetical protein
MSMPPFHYLFGSKKNLGSETALNFASKSGFPELSPLLHISDDVPRLYLSEAHVF